MLEKELFFAIGYSNYLQFNKMLFIYQSDQ